MTAFIVLSLICIAVMAWLIKLNWGDVAEIVFILVMGIIISLIIVAVGTLALAPLTGGMLPGISEGSFDGYLVQVQEEGIIWKTWEATVQPGVGEQAALQTTKEFNIPADKLYLIEHLQGRKIRVHYYGWAITPAWVASSNKIMTKVENLEPTFDEIDSDVKRE